MFPSPVSWSNRKCIYLATPYSHPDPEIRHKRYLGVNLAAAGLIKSGNYVYSPITHCHPLTQLADLPMGWEYWAEFDTAMLQMCHQLTVLKQQGWEESIGVATEIDLAKGLGIPVGYMEAAPGY